MTRPQLAEVSPKFPYEAVVALNHCHPQWHDLYRIHIVTGEMTPLLQHDGFMGVIIDDEYRVRYAAQVTPEGGSHLYVPTVGDWQWWTTIPAEDVLTTQVIGFDKANQLIYMKDSRGRNTSALVIIDPNTQDTRLLADDPQADAADVLLHPTERHVQAVSFLYDRKRW